MTTINEIKIFDLIEKYQKTDVKLIDEILTEAKNAKGLTLAQAARLLAINDEENLQKLFAAANFVKEKIYGRRVVFFAPLYISNYCTNNCLYCGFRVDNKEIRRSSLSHLEIEKEVLAILEQGHKRILLLTGEHSKKATLVDLISTIEQIYSIKDAKSSSIRRINVEIEPLSAEEFKILNQIPIGTYTVFQETYHHKTYEKVHLSGKKADYKWRLEVMDRALANGMHDVGIGALFGLFDYKFEVLSLISHSQQLEFEYGIGPHTISIPRIKYAKNAPLAELVPNAVSDLNFKKLVAILRLAVPFAGIILSTRESADLRMDLLNLGVSQISAGSRTNLGGYTQTMPESEKNSQFHLNDSRTSGEVIEDVIRQGFIPSFCTSCYRSGRIGKDFMDKAKPGLIKLFCQPNGLFTLMEYLLDYSAGKTQKIGLELINKSVAALPENIRNKTIETLEQISNGKRDLYL